MATTIQQTPLFTLVPVGQDVIFVVSNAPIVSSETRVKIIADVYISINPIVVASSTPVGTFKTTPNNAGVGMFNFSPIIESYVSADNLAVRESRYKFVKASERSFPMHLIDRFSENENSVRYMAVVFTTEYLDNNPLSSTFGDIILDTTFDTSLQYKLYNGYVKATDELLYSSLSSSFGFNTIPYALGTIAPGRYLTNAPMLQYATENDYGTVSVMAFGTNILSLFRYIYTKTDGSTVTEDVDRTFSNGAFTAVNVNTESILVFFGCFPGNIRNTSTIFQALIAAGTLESYTVQGFSVTFSPTVEAPCTEILKINLLCPNLKGYEPIRLTWLNQYGAWDYYTFNMKSSKMISTKGTTYDQLEGTWNESTYRADSFKGGKKSFRVNAKEKVTMNTDFVNEAESAWFEELINSPEVYILNGFTVGDGTPLFTTVSFLLNTYVTPVRLTTSSYTTKTIANDKLMQYTFEVEKSKKLSTQSV
tara:strand:- start:1852 stop:3285 length:1434 start_codon:yes stop_codon:yes gene_type:complete